MEHRFSPRSPIRLNAQIYLDQYCLGSFKTRNVGYRGLFIETGPIGLLCGSAVQVSLVIPGAPVLYKLHSIVVHYSAEGVGLLFAAHQAESLSVVGYQLRALNAS
jgi:hypothetical protein